MQRARAGEVAGEETRGVSAVLYASPLDERAASRSEPGRAPELRGLSGARPGPPEISSAPFIATTRREPSRPLLGSATRRRFEAGFAASWSDVPRKRGNPERREEPRARLYIGPMGPMVSEAHASQEHSD